MEPKLCQVQLACLSLLFIQIKVKWLYGHSTWEYTDIFHLIISLTFLVHLLFSVGCPPGSAGLQCKQCPIGEYQPEAGQLSCLQCKKNMTHREGTIDESGCFNTSKSIFIFFFFLMLIMVKAYLNGKVVFSLPIVLMKQNRTFYIKKTSYEFSLNYIFMKSYSVSDCWRPSSSLLLTLKRIVSFLFLWFSGI